MLLLPAAADSHAPLDGATEIAGADCLSDHEAAGHETSCPSCVSPAGLITVPSVPTDRSAASPEARAGRAQHAQIRAPEPAPPESADIV